MNNLGDNMNQLNIGQKIHYTGDMANDAAFGEIIYIDAEVCEVKYDDGKVRVVYLSSFSKGPGQRYKTIEQYNEERAKLSWSRN